MGYFNNGIGAARIDDSSPSDHTTYSSNKIETKQNSTDNTLTTTSKTIVGAINEVNSKVNNKFIVVQTLPVSDIDEFAIYLVPKSTSQTNNIYDEYIYISTDTPAHWEKIGDTEIDLSGYYTSSQIDTFLADKQDATDNSLVTTDKTVVGAINELLSDVGDNSSDIADIITNMGGMKAKTYTVEGSGGLLTLPSYNNVCLIFIGRGEGGLYFGHWTGVTPIVNASNHNVIYYSNPNRINVTNNSGSMDMVLVLSN